MTVFFYYLKLNWVGPGDINGYDLRFFRGVILAEPRADSSDSATRCLLRLSNL